jgi:hypothetical protein
MLIELAFALATQQQTWTVDAQPVVRIGEVEAAPPYMFSGVTGAVRLSDGRIVVADSGTSNLRVYDARGRHVSTLGGPGSGPGEFQRLRGLWPLAGDSLIAQDVRNGRLTLYGPGPAMLSSVQLTPIPGASGRLADGTLLATIGLAPPDKREMKDFHGIFDFDGLVLRRAPTSTSYDTIVRGKAGQSFVQQMAQGFRQYPFPYGRTAQIAIGRTRFYYGDTHGTELGVYGADGKEIGRLKIRGSGRPLSGADIERWIEHSAASRPTEQAKQETRTGLRQIPAPRRTPEFSALRLDGAENLWVRRYGPPWQPSPDWDVYDPAGRDIATVALPQRFEPLQIGSDFLLGVSKDELDVERVELLRLRRGR